MEVNEIESIREVQEKLNSLILVLAELNQIESAQVDYECSRKVMEEVNEGEETKIQGEGSFVLW